MTQYNHCIRVDSNPTLCFHAVTLISGVVCEVAAVLPPPLQDRDPRSSGVRAKSVVRVAVLPVPDAPEAKADVVLATVAYDGSAAAAAWDVLANDFDADADALTVTSPPRPRRVFRRIPLGTRQKGGNATGAMHLVRRLLRPLLRVAFPCITCAQSWRKQNLARQADRRVARGRVPADRDPSRSDGDGRKFRNRIDAT